MAVTLHVSRFTLHVSRFMHRLSPPNFQTDSQIFPSPGTWWCIPWPPGAGVEAQKAHGGAGVRQRRCTTASPHRNSDHRTCPEARSGDHRPTGTLELPPVEGRQSGWDCFVARVRASGGQNESLASIPQRCAAWRTAPGPHPPPETPPANGQCIQDRPCPHNARL